MSPSHAAMLTRSPICKLAAVQQQQQLCLLERPGECGCCRRRWGRGFHVTQVETAGRTAPGAMTRAVQRIRSFSFSCTHTGLLSLSCMSWLQHDSMTLVKPGTFGFEFV